MDSNTVKGFKILTVLFLVIIFVIKSGVSVSITEHRQSQLPLKEQYAIEGSSFKMKCVGPKENLSSSYYIVWTINGRPPTRGINYKILTDGLVIRNVSKEDTLKNYTCTALDRIAFIPVYSENIHLRLRQREGKLLIEPRNFVSTVIREKVKLWGILNQSKTLPCRMYSRPSPIFEWKNEQTGDKIDEDTNTSLYKIVGDETGSNLTIFIQNSTFFGEYSCKAANILGESTQVFVLAQGYKPISPFLLPTFIGKDRVTLRVEPQEEDSKSKVKGNAESLPITNYLIQYATVDSIRTNNGGNPSRKKWNTISRAVMADGKTSFHIKDDGEVFELKGLQDNTTYLIRAAVTNAAATSNFSPAIRVTTDITPSQSQRRPVYVKKEDAKEKPEKVDDRADYARSSINQNDLKVTAPSGPDPDAENIDTGNKKTPTEAECGQPKYKKTVIITTISTTLFENMIDGEEATGNQDKNSSLIKKHVEEDTKVERMNVCSFK